MEKLTDKTLEKVAETTVKALMEIQDNASEWFKLTQHCTRHSMNRTYQLERSQKYFQEIMSILREVYDNNLTTEQISDVEHTLMLRDSP